MIMRQVSTHSTLREGFSLVETALALLVASIGLTAIIALVPTAMNQGKKASDDTYAAFFADVVFASYQAALNSDQVSWAELITYTSIPPVTINNGKDVFWKDSKDMTFVADNSVRTQLFIATSSKEKWPGMPLPSAWYQYDHALRYRLNMEDIPNTRRRSKTLEVWPGEYGVLSNAYRFASEVFDYGI